MNQQSQLIDTRTETKQAQRPKPARCQHRGPSGRRCRAAIADSHSGLCLNHKLGQQHVHMKDVAEALIGGDVAKFKSAEGIHNSLFELYRMLAENRISARRAAVLAYIGSMLMRGVSAIKSEEKDAPQHIIIDVPRPQRNFDDASTISN